MSQYPRPLPIISDYTKPLWEGCKKRKLMIQRCRDCGRYIWYPRPSCNKCGSLNLEWVESKGFGTVYSFTVIRRVVANSPDFQKDIPFAIAEVDMDEGVRIYGRLVDVKPEEVEVGMRVRAAFDEATPEVTLYVFKPLS